MVHNMRLLLLNDPLKDLLDATRSVDRAAGGLAADQDEDSGCDAEDRHNNIQAGKAEFEQCDQSGQDQPDAEQQQYACPSFMVHQTLPGRIHRVGSVFLRHLGEGWVGSARCVPGAGFNIGQASAPGHYGLNMIA